MGYDSPKQCLEFAVFPPHQHQDPDAIRTETCSPLLAPGRPRRTEPSQSPSRDDRTHGLVSQVPRRPAFEFGLSRREWPKPTRVRSMHGQVCLGVADSSSSLPPPDRAVWYLWWRPELLCDVVHSLGIDRRREGAEAHGKHPSSARVCRGEHGPTLRGGPSGRKCAACRVVYLGPRYCRTHS